MLFRSTHALEVVPVFSGKDRLAIVLEGALGPGGPDLVDLLDQFFLQICQGQSVSQGVVIGRFGVGFEVGGVHEANPVGVNMPQQATKPDSKCHVQADNSAGLTSSDTSADLG